MIVAPAGELSEKRITLATKRLREIGFEVLLPDNLYRVRGYLAGSDEQRAAELMQAFTDPRVDAVFPGTGGYGTMRMLDLLDFDKIRANPKMLIKCEPSDSGSLSLNEVFSDYFADATYPVVNHFPAGHVSINMTLPFGVRARVDANRLKVQVLENPVRSD